MRKELHGQKASKNTRKGEEDFLTQTEELKGQVEVDKATMVDITDSFRAWLNICDEAEVILETRR